VGQFRSFVQATGYVTDAERDAPVGSNPAAGCFSHRLQGQRSAGWVAGRSWQYPGYPQGDDHPVVCVSWRDAQAYVTWLAGVTGRPFRLLSESEFEYLARDEVMEPPAGQQVASVCAGANLADASLAGAFPDWPEVAPCDDGHAFTAPVDAFPANGFGVQGLEGNVSEWTQDCWHDDYHGAPGDGVAWQPDDAQDCGTRVLRGGDFFSAERQLRAAHRTSIPPAFRTYHAGFRVAAGPE